MTLTEKIDQFGEWSWNITKKATKSLTTRYLPLAGLVTLETPLHEATHAALAHILPGTSCEGIALSNTHWYAHYLPWLTFGYFKARDLPPGIDGQALIISGPGTVSNLSASVVSAAPEILTMALGFYLIKKGMQDIKHKGHRIYATACSVAGMAFGSSSYYYLQNSVLNPHQGNDHYEFTKHLLNSIPFMPAFATDPIANTTTLIGAGLMGAAALAIATVIPVKDKSELY